MPAAAARWIDELDDDGLNYEQRRERALALFAANPIAGELPAEPLALTADAAPRARERADEPQSEQRSDEASSEATDEPPRWHEVSRFETITVCKVAPREKTPLAGWQAGHPRSKLAQHVKRGGNFGVVTGRGLLVLDVDPRNGGTESLERLTRDLGLDLSGCLQVETGGGGRHYYMRAGEEAEGFPQKLKDYPGLDILGKPHLVIAPGSVHPSGGLYRWAFESAARLGKHGRVRDHITPAPPALLALLRTAAASAPRQPAESGSTPAASSEPGSLNAEGLAAKLAKLDALAFRDHERWREVFAAAHHATGGSDEGLDAFLAWSLGDPRYAGDAEKIRARWRSWKLDKARSLTAKTLDYYIREAGGHPESAEQIFPDDQPAPTETPRPKPGLLTVSEFLEQVKPAPPIVDGFLYGSGVFVLFGQWGLGKTYVALDLGLSVAHGLPRWHARDLHLAGRVVFLALEGEYAIPNRLRAWHAHHTRDVARADLLLFRGAMNLTRPDVRRSAAEMLKAAEPRFIVADTLSASLAGADENAAGAVGEVLEWSRGIVRETGAPLLWLHHPGKKDPNSARGSSTLEANSDGVLQLKRPGADLRGMTLTARKVRSSAPGAPLRLDLMPVELPGGGSDAVPVLATLGGTERDRRLQALVEAVTAAGGVLSAVQAAQVVADASSEPLAEDSAAKWLRANLKADPDPFYLLARRGGRVELAESVQVLEEAKG